MLRFWLKLLIGLTGIAVILTMVQVVLAPYQNLVLKFDGQIGDFDANQIVADHDITNTSTLLATPNCIVVPTLTGSLSCITQSGAARWQTILTDALSSPPLFVSAQQTLLLSQYGGGLLMVSEKTGEIMWQFKDLAEFNWKQTLISQDQKLVALLNSRNQVFVFEIATGKLLWKTAENTSAPIEPKTKIFIHEDRVFVADSAAFTLASLSFETGTQIWRQQNYGGDSTINPEFTQNLVWYPTNFYTWQGVFPATGEVKAKISPPAGSTVTNLATSLVFHSYGNQLFWFDAQNGAALETTQTPGKIQKTWFDKKLFVKIAAAPFSEKISVIDPIQRTTLWNSEALQIIKDFLVLNADSLAIVSLDGRVTWLKLETGELISQLKTQETPLLLKQSNSEAGMWLVTTHHGTFSTAKELTDVWFFKTPGKLTLHHPDLPVVGATSLVYKDKLWMVNQSQNSVIALTTQSLQHDLRFWLRPVQKLPLRFNFALRKTSPENQLALETEVTKNFQGCLITTTITPHNALLKNLAHRSGSNPWQDTAFITTLTRNSEIISSANSYYFLPDRWRTVLLAPELTATETLILETKLVGAENAVIEKIPVTIPAGCTQNFITLSADKKYLRTATDEFFWGMGIQDVMLDVDNSGSVFDDWQFGLTDEPNFSVELAKHDFKTYLKTFRQAGFSLFRISQDNFSFKNWLSFQPTSFRGSLHTGLITDEFLKQLKTENYHVVFGIFGFQPETESTAITAYLDYCIARFGPWIDIWEISNEAWPEEKWVAFVSDYLKKHDPYQHPITTSWDRSNLPNIDIVNLHYYRSEPTTELTAEFLNQIFTNQSAQKPIVFGEFGNSEINWDHNSSERLRIKSWLSAWQRTPLIIWNQSGSAATQKENSNLYLGTKEREVTRKLVGWLGKYDGIPLRPFSLKTTTGNFCSGLTNAESLMLIYCTNSSDTPRTELFKTTEILTAAGIKTTAQNWKISWFDPKTLTLKDTTSFATTHTPSITSPAFSSDSVSEWRLDQ